MLAFKILMLYLGGGGPYRKPCHVFVFLSHANGRRKNREGEKNLVLNQTLEIVKMLGFCANWSPKGLCPQVSLKNKNKIIGNCKKRMGGKSLDLYK